jgi:hypothetical protein
MKNMRYNDPVRGVRRDSYRRKAQRKQIRSGHRGRAREIKKGFVRKVGANVLSGLVRGRGRPQVGSDGW